MAEGMRGVICSLSECMYFVRQSGRVYCKHPEVHSNPPGATCPFYKMDWSRKAEELTKRFAKR